MAEFSRRWFLRGLATATTALVAAHVLPITAVPLSGDVHDVLHQDILQRLHEAWGAHIQQFHRPPRLIHVGQAFFRAYEGELDAFQRLSSKDGPRRVYWDNLLFRGIPVCPTLLGPWALSLTPA